jgi:DNA-binding response OmpR family regulator
MQLKIYVIGNKNITRRVASALAGSDIEACYQNNISEAISLLMKEKFDLVLLDGYMDDLDSTCYRITWFCRTPVALVINGSEDDWDTLRNLEVEGFIPEEVNNVDLVPFFTSIALRYNTRFEKVKILIIEDDAQTQEAVIMSFGIYWPESRIACTGSGKDGLKLFKEFSPDVVLLDLKLPDITGYDVLANIRLSSQVPVIIISATRSQENVTRCLELGANDYLVKPYKQLELMSRIRKFISWKTAVS